MWWTTILLANAAAAAERLTFLSAIPPYTKCAESTLTWAGGTPPYKIMCKDKYANLRTIQGHLNETTYKFMVDFPSG